MAVNMQEPPGLPAAEGQYPYSRGPLPSTKVVSSHGWYVAKLVLGGISTLLSIVMLGIGGAFAAADKDWLDALMVIGAVSQNPC